MKFERLAIPDVILVTPVRHGDLRGFFSETYQESRYAEHGINGPFVQDNHSLSEAKGVIRGLHCQLAPFEQGKLVRVARGAVWDVAIDIRAGSPTYGRFVSAVLSAENWQQLWIPPGFLHGFCTLEPNTEFLYKVTAPYDRASERSVIWNDPSLALPWPIAEAEITVSERDRQAPGFEAARGWFA